MSRVRIERPVKYHNPVTAWHTLSTQMRLLGQKIRRTENCAKKAHPDRRDRIQKVLEGQLSEMEKLRLRRSLAIQQISDVVERQSFSKETVGSVHGA